jgi:LAO/AO transport system kinase
LVQELVERMRAGDQRSLARLLTLVERSPDDAVGVLEAVHAHTGHATIVGITGPPGAGKSTLVDKLTSAYRNQGSTVGIVAVDPTSPFSGGAFLGDRIRMQRHYLDSGVFIRSVATRGGTGGLPRMTRSAIRVLDASGKDVIILETVGVGQTELEVMSVADTVVVTLVPEAGDAIQTLKAGLLEIADIFVVNKSDRAGASQFAAYLDAMLNLAESPSWWRPPVIQTQADTGDGIPLLHETIGEHRRALDTSEQMPERLRQRGRHEFFKTVEEAVGDLILRLEQQDSATAAAVAEVERGEQNPFVAAHRLLGSGALLREWLETLGGRT